MKMENYKCSDCGKEFGQKDSMDQHISAKHRVHVPVSSPKKRTGKIVYGIGAFAALLVLVLAFNAFSSDDATPGPSVIIDPRIIEAEVPRQGIHWHPNLEVVVLGRPIPVPANLGMGSPHQPIHTHDTTGQLHYEMARPTAQTMQLSYFFERVWRVTFNSTCILEYCNGPDGNVTMLVNGVPNDRFETYVPQDEEKIRIEFG